MENRYQIAVLVAITVAAVAYTASLEPIAQDPIYHNFADDRVFLGIANFLNVASNLPFLFVGLWGVFVVCNRRTTFVTNIERWPYTTFFLGVVLTSFGSSYYHLHPDNMRLVWDRLPMALGFMGILSAALAERVHRKASVALLPSLVSAGIASVIYWYVTETGGNGDLRPYVLVQFGSLLILVVSFLLFHSPYTKQRWFLIALSTYMTSKLLESFDEKIYETFRFVSGHTLKHLAAAAAACCIVQMLRHRSITHAGTTLCEPVRSMVQYLYGRKPRSGATKHGGYAKRSFPAFDTDGKNECCPAASSGCIMRPIPALSVPRSTSFACPSERIKP